MPYWPFAHRESVAVAAVPPGAIVLIEETLRGSMQDLFAAHEKAGQPELWDLHVDDKIPSAPYRRIHFGEV